MFSRLKDTSHTIRIEKRFNIMTTKDQYAFIHGCYCPSRFNDTDDAVVVKRYKVLPDGTRIPEMKVHENVQRSYWLTKPAYRKHDDGKLEYEYLNRLDHHRSNQRQLVKNIQRKLGMMPNRQTQLRQLCNSPYIYGVDKDITCIVNDNYKKGFPDVEPFDAEVGCMDTETNVVDGSGDLIIMSFYHGNKAIVAIHESWVTDKRTGPKEYKEFIDANVPEVAELNIDVEVVFCETPAECIISVINRAHEWKPDIIGFWNINFDMPLVMSTLEKEGHDLADIFSDPSVPTQFRYFKYKEGQTSKLTDSGKYMPLAPSQQWHTVLTPASFYFIDPSSTYRCLRRQKSEPSYALDPITRKEVGSGKLKPKGLEHMENAPEGTLKWHYNMQKFHKMWYAAYALVDVIQPVRMDRKTNDLSKKLPTLSMGSHYKDFNSNPRRLCDQLHQFFLGKGAVVGTTGAEMESPLDKHIPASKDWIVTLEAPIIEDFGLRLLDADYKENPIRKGMRLSKMFIHNADLDIVSTYPILGMVFNIARETAMFETCKIEGLGYHPYREFGINLTAGKANSMVIGEEVFGLKGFADQLEDFEKAHGLASTRDAIQTECDAKAAERKQRIKERNQRSLELLEKMEEERNLEEAA